MSRLSFAISAFALIAFSSCSDPDMDAACAGKYEKVFSQAAESLNLLNANRRVSSTDVTARTHSKINSQLSEEERETWEAWALTNLVGVQHLIDKMSYISAPQDQGSAKRLSELKAELSSTADELVQVHGLIHGGYLESAVGKLNRLEKRAVHSHELARDLASNLACVMPVH